MGINESIDITPDQTKIILTLLSNYIPNATVWAYGSRVRWTARPSSDLDMVAFIEPEEKSLFYSLKEAFDESNLPFRVDLFNWDEVPDQFYKNIQAQYVVLQEFNKPVWEIVQLGGFCQKIGSGATPRGGSSVYLDEGKVSLIRSQNIYNDGFKPNGLVYITEDAAQKLKNVIVKKNDILLNITGDSVARVCLVNNNYLPARVNQHVAIIRPNQSHFNERFLCYQFTSPQTQSLLLTLSSAGATRNALTKNMIETLNVSKPPLKLQKAIAHILGSLDDKIELNRQMNKTLESMAQALFKSWFVDFDPVIDNALAAGHPIPDEFAERAEQRRRLKQEKKGEVCAKNTSNTIQTPFPNEFEYTEEMGWIPKGWEVGKLNELLEVKYGKDHKKLESGTIPVYGSGGLMRFVNKSLYIGESILIPRKGTLSNLMFVDEEFWTVDTMFFSIPKLKYSAKYLFHQLNMLDFSSMNVGSAVPSMTTKVLNDLNILKPEDSLLKEFDKFATDFFTRGKALDEASDSLAKLRDTLLPKLLSGELRIPDAEKLINIL